MRQLILSDTYLESQDKLSKHQKRIALRSIKQFARDEKGNNFKVHKLEREACDPSFRSARLSDNLRLIFSLKGNDYILLYVDNHDDAYRWARNRYLHKNAFNAVYLYDQSIDPITDQGVASDNEHHTSNSFSHYFDGYAYLVSS